MKLFNLRGLVETHFEVISKIINDFDYNLSNTLECQRIAIVVLSLCVSINTCDCIFYILYFNNI